MKKILVVVGFILIFYPNLWSLQAEKKDLEGRLTISGAWALYPLALRWAEEFQKAHPRIRLDVQAGGAGKGIADVLAGIVDIGMVSRNIYPAEISKGAFPLAVTTDAVVPTICAGNPLLDKILRQGLKKEDFIAIWVTGQAKTWGDALGSDDKAPLHIFTRSDACGAAETWANYLDKRQEDLLGIAVYGDPGLAEAVRKDRLGIGFNNINYAYDAKTKKPISGLQVLPLDLNGNGRVDDEEAFYATRDDLTRAIAQNKFPSPPARDLFFVTRGKPDTELLLVFLRWVLSEGQKYVEETGYIPISTDRLAEEAQKIEGKSE